VEHSIKFDFSFETFAEFFSQQQSRPRPDFSPGAGTYAKAKTVQMIQRIDIAFDGTSYEIFDNQLKEKQTFYNLLGPRNWAMRDIQAHKKPVKINTGVIEEAIVLEVNGQLTINGAQYVADQKVKLHPKWNQTIGDYASRK